MIGNIIGRYEVAASRSIRCYPSLHDWRTRGNPRSRFAKRSIYSFSVACITPSLKHFSGGDFGSKTLMTGRDDE